MRYAGLWICQSPAQSGPEMALSDQRLSARAASAQAYLCADRQPPRDQEYGDEDVLEMLDKAAVSYRIVMTKADKVKAGTELEATKEKVIAAMPKNIPPHILS